MFLQSHVKVYEFNLIIQHVSIYIVIILTIIPSY
jgi:hypothetical protein